VLGNLPQRSHPLEYLPAPIASRQLLGSTREIYLWETSFYPLLQRH
jgi:hypothetical protein